MGGEPSPGGHVVFREQRDLQDLGASHDLLVARGGDRLPRHAVHLVERVRTQVAVVCGADEELEAERLRGRASELGTSHIRD